MIVPWVMPFSHALLSLPPLISLQGPTPFLDMVEVSERTPRKTVLSMYRELDAALQADPESCPFPLFRSARQRIKMLSSMKLWAEGKGMTKSSFMSMLSFQQNKVAKDLLAVNPALREALKVRIALKEEELRRSVKYPRVEWTLEASAAEVVKVVIEQLKIDVGVRPPLSEAVSKMEKAEFLRFKYQMETLRTHQRIVGNFNNLGIELSQRFLSTALVYIKAWEERDNEARSQLRNASLLKADFEADLWLQTWKSLPHQESIPSKSVLPSGSGEVDSSGHYDPLGTGQSEIRSHQVTSNSGSDVSDGLNARKSRLKRSSRALQSVVNWLALPSGETSSVSAVEKTRLNNRLGRVTLSSRTLAMRRAMQIATLSPERVQTRADQLFASVKAGLDSGCGEEETLKKLLLDFSEGISLAASLSFRLRQSRSLKPFFRSLTWMWRESALDNMMSLIPALSERKEVILRLCSRGWFLELSPAEQGLLLDALQLLMPKEGIRRKAVTWTGMDDDRDVGRRVE